MARARNIKPGFFESEQVGSVSMGARLLFIALWQLADREGRLIERPMQIRAYAFRYDPITAEQAAAWLDELEASKLIERFPFMGQTAIEIPAFSKHQRPHSKEPQSVIARNISGEPEKNRATPPFHEQKPEIFLARPHSMTGEPEKVRASASWNGGEPALNPEYGMLNAEVLNAAPAPKALPPPAAQPSLLDVDPQAEFKRLAGELVQLLPAAGDVHLTERQLEIEYSSLASFADDPVAFADSVRESAKRWRKAWDQNPALRPKAAQWWLKDGDHARRPPEPAAAKQGGMKRLIDMFPEVPNAS